ncbi:MAG: hypothetical protein ACW98Y_06490 [Candidatus Thorarchaeota archaeon]|jgi:hypothetical protein
MSKDVGWDYSEIPERKWTWNFVEDHWMDCIVNPDGLTYRGTDWTCQSGGGYFGGFQTFEEFLSDRPLQKMPRKTIKEVKDYIFEHRKVGGATLRLVYVHDVQGFKLTGVFVHLDDSPIHVKRVKAEGEMLIFDGSITQGGHSFSFVFVLNSNEEMKKIDGEVRVDIQIGENHAVLKTTEDEKGKLDTRLESVSKTR